MPEGKNSGDVLEACPTVNYFNVVSGLRPQPHFDVGAPGSISW